MPNWNQLLNEIKAAGSMHDVIRRRYLKIVHEVTGRNVIIYYSGWLQKRGVAGAEINDEDKNGFMTVIHELDRSLGLDLILHTPGGETAATESLVDYLRSMFGSDVRAIVPQLAMSGGTMIACACKEILMGKQSSLGPIDPHFGGIPAHGVVEEFERAKKEISKDASAIPVWQPIIAKYDPAFIGECEKAIAWSNEMTKEWLRTGMFAGEKAPNRKINKILNELGDHALTKSHARHLSMERCRDMGLKVSALESNDNLQDAVLSLHHACMLTFSATPAFKIIENHRGIAFIKITQPVIVAGPRVPGQEVEEAPNKAMQRIGFAGR
ncbi:MAG TPA: S49 family peptidase [Planctomycetaceae bacterium]|nr:S49 family peptidase [Planctomycetaceae bacterium]